MNPKKSSARRKNPRFDSLVPDELERLRERSLRFERGVAVDAFAADGRQVRRERDALEQRRLSRTVLADEKGDGLSDVEPLEVADDRHAEREHLVRRRPGWRLQGDGA